jgi:hypothetical protein
MNCVACPSKSAGKVLYAGFPMRFCAACSSIWGFWSFIPMRFGFNGMLFSYDGSYPKALWAFLRGL